MIFDESVKAVIFDMDGVLLDTESVCKVCWKRAADEYGVERIEEAFMQCVGQNSADSIILLKKYCAGKVDSKDFYARTGELFHEVEREQGLNLMPFVTECLSGLRERGYRLAVASSTRWENVERQLKAAKIFDFFETVTTGDKVLHSKPAPDIYIKALESLSLSAGDCIAVEDSPNGVRAASRAGIRCVMVPDLIQPSDEIKSLAWKILPSLEELI